MSGSSSFPSPQHSSSRIPGRALTASRHELRSINRRQIIGVAIDPAKTFHKVLLFDFNLDIIEGPFDIDVLRSGWERLLASIEKAKRLRRTQRVVVGLEASGAYSWHLSRELAERFTQVYLFNPLSVATARKQKLLLGQKTDAIDVAVIGDLILRGQGYPLRRPQAVFVELRERTYWRHHKTHLIGELKQQITDRFEKVFPGLTASANGTKPLIREVSRSHLAVGLIEQGLTPQQILRSTPKAIRQRLRAYLGPYGRPSPVRLQQYLNGVLFGPEAFAEMGLGLLKRDLAILQNVQREIAEVEQEMVALVRQTPGRWLLGQIRGLSDVQVASYIGALGVPGGLQQQNKSMLSQDCPHGSIRAARAIRKQQGSRNQVVRFFAPSSFNSCVLWLSMSRCSEPIVTASVTNSTNVFGPHRLPLPISSIAPSSHSCEITNRFAEGTPHQEWDLKSP